MKLNLNEKLKNMLEPKRATLPARLFVTRDDGITVYDSVQNKTSAGVAALVSGVWQASEALMGLVKPSYDGMEFRLGFDTSEEGVFLFPLKLNGKKYFLGAIYQDCLNPGQLKRQISMLKNHLEQEFNMEPLPEAKTTSRQGYLFTDITDEEMDRLFSAGGI